MRARVRERRAAELAELRGGIDDSATASARAHSGLRRSRSRSEIDDASDGDRLRWRRKRRGSRLRRGRRSMRNRRWAVRGCCGRRSIRRRGGRRTVRRRRGSSGRGVRNRDRFEAAPARRAVTQVRSVHRIADAASLRATRRNRRRARRCRRRGSRERICLGHAERRRGARLMQRLIRRRRRLVPAAQPDGRRGRCDARAETLAALLTERQVGGVVTTTRRASHDVVLERSLTLRRMGQYGCLTVKQASVPPATFPASALPTKSRSECPSRRPFVRG
jgi:hypothetical protein